LKIWHWGLDIGDWRLGIGHWGLEKLKDRIEHGMSRVNIAKNPGLMGRNLLKDMRFGNHLQWINWLGKNVISGKKQSFISYVKESAEW